MLNGQSSAIDVSQAKLAAQHAALGVLALLVQATEDQPARFKRMVRLGVFVASAVDFQRHSEVANGASEVFTDLFGASGKHTRTAVGVTSLPAGALVEVDAIFELEA
jgi:enamine deaminase RidA (YjgF/YER057c/UK114 family)